MDFEYEINKWWVSNGDKLIEYADAIIFLLFLIAVLYIFIFSLASLKKTRNKYPPARKKHRFAVLFPAYQEDAVIVNSVCSFLEQDYPSYMYEVIVIADKMQERTVQTLKALPSITVLEAGYAQSTKTNALRLAMDYLSTKTDKCDMVVIMDADNIVNASFLNKLNDAYYSGCLAIQTHRVAKNRNTNTAVLDAVSEEINNSIFRSGHTRLGFSSALIGSGMAFDYDWLRQYIYRAAHVGVDKQLESMLLSQNIYIEFLEDVYTYDEKIEKKGQFYEQRRRWIATQFTNLFSGLWKLPKAFFSGNWDYCDKLLQWMMPPRIILFGFLVIFSIVTTWYDWSLSLKWWGITFILIVSFFMAIPDYLVDNRFQKAIISLPLLFILMFLNLFRLRGANKKFIHTVHSDHSSDKN